VLFIRKKNENKNWYMEITNELTLNESSLQ
jgi:hypothetical protein